MSNTAYLLTAHLILSTGEPVDVLISIHLNEAACLQAIPSATKGRKRRYDCKPMSQPSADIRYDFNLKDIRSPE